VNPAEVGDKLTPWVVRWKGPGGETINRRVRAHTPEAAWERVASFSTSRKLLLPPFEKCVVKIHDQRAAPPKRRRKDPWAEPPRPDEPPPPRSPPKLTPPSRAARRGL
jgi:hypothetical protein